jgi:hypothetical protein
MPRQRQSNTAGIIGRATSNILKASVVGVTTAASTAEMKIAHRVFLRRNGPLTKPIRLRIKTIGGISNTIPKTIITVEKRSKYFSAAMSGTIWPCFASSIRNCNAVGNATRYPNTPPARKNKVVDTMKGPA